MRPRAAPPAAVAPARPPFRRKYLVEALEPRLLLSADVLPVVPPPPEPVHDAHPAEAVAAAAGGAHALPQFQFDATHMATDFAAASAPDAPPAHEAAPAPTEIAFVDGRVVGQDALTLQKDGMLVVVLDANQDGLAQISEVLAQNHDITAVHIIAHGDSGEMFLGTSVLDSQAIADGKVADWGKALTADGDLLLYGCDVAQGEAGQTFVQQLAAATGADVGASTDATGAATLGGNWMLEYTVGKLEATPLQPAEFGQLLATFAGTSGADNFTTGTGNDVYNFLSANLDSGDKIADPSGADDLVITDAATVIDSDFTQITGIDRLVLGNFANSLTLGSLAVTAAGTAAGGAMDIVGGTGTDSLSFAGFGSDLVFAFNGDGSIDVKIAGTTRFHVTGVENLTGGTGADTLDYSGRTGDVSVDLQTSQATGLTLFSSIETIIGGSGTNTLSGSDGAVTNIFSIQNNGDVVIGALTVKGFNDLQGGAGANTVNKFVFAAAGHFNGSIAGNGLTNVLDYSGYGTNATVNLTLATATKTAAGSVQGVTGTVSDDITEVKGSAHDDTYIFGDDIGGKTVTDTAGSNTLSFSGADTSVSVTFNASDAIGVKQGSATLTANGAFDTVEGSNDDDVFLAKANVTVDALVKGGLGDDRFQMEEGGDYQGGVDGGGGSEDIVDYKLRGGNLAASTDNTLENVSGGLTNIEKIQHPYSIFDGINDFFTSLQDGIDATIGTVSLPLVGNLNSAVSGFVSDLRDFLLTPLDDVLIVDYVPGTVAHPTASTVELIEDALTVEFAGSVPGATTAEFGFHIIGNANDPDRAEFALILEGVVFQDDWDIDFAAAVPGLGLSAEPGSQIELSLTYTARLAFGFDFNINKFYFDTDGADDKTDSVLTPSEDDVEINFKLEASFSDDTSIILNLGFLQFEASSYDNSDQKMQDDPGTDSPYQDDKHSGFFAEFGIDLKDPGSDAQNVADGWAVNDGILTTSEFKDSHFKLKENLAVVMKAYADVDLFMRLSADVISGGLPSIQFYLHYDQQFGNAEITFDGKAQGTGIEAPTVVIEDLSLDLGTFFTDFLKPVLDEVKTVTEPLQPVVDFLKTDIPILSDIDILKNLLNKDGQGGVDVLDFAGTLLGNTKYASVVTAVNALAELIDLVNHIPDDADTILINFGTYTFGGSGNDLRDSGSQMSLPNTSGYNSGQSISQNQSISSSTKGFLSSLTRDPVQGGFSVPILTDPAQIIKLITGRDDAVLVMYDLPQLDFGVNFHKSVPLVFPLNMVLDAGFDVKVQLGFGFDVSGIKEFAQGGYSDFAAIFKGFFIDDHIVNGVDQDEVLVTAHFTVGASVGVSGIIEAGVQGGITGTFGFNFNDVDHNGPLAGGVDGHIHFDELKLMVQQQGILGFLDMHGSLDWFLQAFVWVGLDLGFFGKITLYDETFDLGGGNIVTFENHYNVSIPPNVAHIDGSGNLVLHMGSDASHRADGASAGYSDLDGTQAETYDVSLDEDGTHYLVSYNGTTTAFAASAVTGKIVVNDAQGGNDVLTVGEGVTAGLIFHGGDGDDRVSYLGTGTAQIFGDAGNDRITANTTQHSNANRITVGGQTPKFDAQLDGGAGNDQITVTQVESSVAAGNVYVNGDTGNDKIKTRGGDDVIFGGDETDLTAGKANGDIIDAGAGNDTIFGGGGSDSIKGGDGDDLIDGGNETVIIVRNADGSINAAASTGLTTLGKAVGDTIDGGDGNDTIYAGEGFDTIRGGDGVDTIRGGAGDDNITGGAGLDVIFGDGANSASDGSASSRTGNDTINWAVGDGNDTTVDAGTGNDSIILAGGNADATTSLSASSGNVAFSWASGSATSTLTLIGIEKATLNLGTGADTVTINDLASTTLRQLSINLGSTVQNVTQYDVNGDGQYHALPVPLLDSSGHLQTTTDGNGHQHLVYANGTSLTDVPNAMLDAEGHVLYTVSNNGTPSDTSDDFQVPVYDDGSVASKVVSQSVVDSAADKVTVNGSSIADGFVITNTAVSGVTSPSYTLTRQDLANPANPLLSLSLSQGNFATDTLTVNGLGGNDSIDASKVTAGVAELHLDGGTGNDRIIGSQLADKIQGGDGNDTITGNAGLDVFSDSSGTADTLVETRDKDFDLSSNTLKVGPSSDGESEDVTLFERFTLTGGASANVFTVHDFNKTVVLDGAAGGDQYLITFKGSGSSSITEQDSGGTAGLPDSMKIYGTTGNDNIQSLAVTTTSGTIAEINGTGATPPSEVVRYNVTETLDVDGLGGDDVFSIDDTSMEINFIGNAGNDKFTVGHVETEIVYHDAWLLSSGDLLFVITLNGSGKPIHPITGVVDNGATLSNGKWTFSDGFVASTPTIDQGTHQPIDPATGNPDPGAVFYDAINVADKLTNGISYQAFLFGGDGDDSFEVNHNLAEVFLNGEAGNDRFVINANLTNDAQSNISGGDGSNHIEYVQNAKVFIDGGTGFDVVVINGTSIGDTFIITTVFEDLIDEHGNFILDGSGNHVQGEVQKVVGAGLQIGKIANVEQLEVNGGGGPDKIYVYGTLPGMALLVSGGSGDDTIYIGGDTVSVTGVTPAHFEQPPTIPAYDETVITGYQTITVDPPGYYYWDWDSFPYLFFYDPPQYSYLEPIIQVIHHDTVTPPKTLVPAQAYTFTQPAKFDVTGIKGTFSINGEDGSDTVIVNNQSGANTSAATTGSLDLNTVVGSSSSTDYTALSGFGVAAGEKINITNAETLNLNLGAFDDHLTITHTDALLTTNVSLGNGANTVDVTASAGDLNVTGGTGNDKLNLGSLAPTMSGGTLANITGAITFAAGGGSDTLILDNSSNPALSASVTVNASSISTLNEFGGITSYSGVETLSLNLGAGADTINVTGTSAVTTINASGGNDVINVSSDGATLLGSLDGVAQTLNLHAGTGNNTLNVSDFGDADADASVVVTSSSITGLAPAAINYDAVSGRFTGGINLWAGTGNDGVTISSTTLADVTTFFGNAGNDTITVANLTGGSNRFLSIHGDAGDDTIDASAIQALDFTVLLFGDSGEETYSGADKQFAALTAAASTSPATGGTDTLKGGNGRALLIGGVGGDTLISKDGSDVLIGDNGSVQLVSGVVTQINSTDVNGAGDTITAAGGANYIIGGAGGDGITALTGTDDVVFGDNGTATFTTGGAILSAVSADLGSGGADTIDVGDGNNVVIGGAGNDTITTLDGTDVVIGDNGEATWTAGVLTQFKSADLAANTGGDDTIGVGNGRNYVIGGVGIDNITAGTGDDVVLGDNGIVNFAAVSGIITDAATSEDGLGGGESLDAGDGNNVLIGGAGNDTISALDGTDVVLGDNGSATWTSGVLTQFKSSDTVAGTGGDDTIGVGNGRNYVIGGVGIDNATAGTGDDVMLGDNGIVNFVAGSGIIKDAATTQDGLGGGESLDAGAGDNVLIGGAGNDILTSLGGTDVAIGDNGSASWTGTVLTQFKSSDTAAATGGDDAIDVGDGSNYVIGGVGQDGIAAGTGDDVVLGDSGIVNFTSLGVITDAAINTEGTGGDDTIDVGGGNNVVLAGDGGDDVTALDGTDVVIGDNGSAVWTGGVLTSFTSNDTGAGGDDTISIGTTAATAGKNYAIGGVGQDTITGGENDDVVLGDNGIVHFAPDGAIMDATVLQIGTGDMDAIDVRGGNNVVLAGAGGDSVSAGAGVDVIIGDSGTATWTGTVLTHLESTDPASSTGGGDMIDAGDGDNTILGGVGNDVIDAGTGNDVVLGDSGAVNFTSAGVILDATITNEGTGGDDTIDVDGGNNVVLAGDGIDSVTALDGEDVVIGDNGQALWTGGTLTTLTSHNTGAGGDDTINVGTVAATAGKNYVIGGIGQDTITGGQNDDVVLGDNGIVHFDPGGVIMDASVLQVGTGDADTIDVRGGNNVVLAGAGGDQVTALGGLDLVIGDNGRAGWTGGVLTRFETTDLLATTGGDDTIDAGGGDNYVIGGVGADGITSGAGNDVVLGDSGVVNFTSTGVITDATITLEGSGGNDAIDAGDGDNVVLAGDGADTVTALDGIDVVIGDNGSATWTGGVLTSFTSANTGAGGDDTIDIGTTAAIAGKNYAIGGIGKDTITGGENDDVVLGDNGIVDFTSGGVITDATVSEIGTGDVDTIDVRGGNNVVLAGAGGDSVSAGAGVDVVIGDNGSASWSGGIVTQVRSSDTTAASGGNDTIAAGDGRNYVIGGVGADGITSGAGNDVVLGDNGVVNFTNAGVITDANATELGLGGIDTIDAGGGHNVIIGGAQGDTVTSGAGNDVIIGDNGRLTFAAGVLAEAVTTDTTDATGGNDTITAGDGNNVVLAGVGDDHVTTGGGNDVVIGDNGIAQFDAAGLVSMVEARDPLRIGDDTINAGDGNDVVIGGGGADTIFGEAGNDVLIGDGGTANFLGGSVTLVIGDVSYGAADFVDSGSGNDILLGGAGDDTLVANLTDDLFTGGNARISFDGGLVTTIEILDGVDLVMQQLFDSFTAPQEESVLIEESGSAGGGGETPIGALLADSIGSEGIFASDGTALLPGNNALTFSFGRPAPLSQVPELLRNIVLELSLGAGVPPPAHAGESGGQGSSPAEGPGNGGAPNDSGSPQDDAEQPKPSAALPFSLEDEASTLVPESTADEAPVAAVAAAALAGLARPATRPVLERDAFAPRRIDW
ncbi:MAG TPA: DUF4347 domain-containing protein [Burkholderiales bacterium]|nr:DUF4347 domain-containing protein [Burkholderiales bacterium]